MIRWRDLIVEFARAGTFTLGGGQPTIAELRKRLMEERGELPVADFGLLFGISRITPGTNVLAFVAAAGDRLRGWPGAVAAVLAASLPSAVAVALMTVCFEAWSANRWVAAALGGAMAGVIALVLDSTWQFLRPNWNWPPGLAIAALAFAAATADWASPLTILLAAGAAGAVWAGR